MPTDPNCIFCKIVAGQIPAKKVFEDDQVLAFHDIHPWAPVHILLIPKVHLTSMVDVGPEHRDLLGHMMVLSSRLMASWVSRMATAMSSTRAATARRKCNTSTCT